MFLVNCVGAGPWIEGCGNVCIPAEVAKLTTLIYNAIRIIVPIALIIIGMVDMAKAITTKSEDEVKKAQQLLVKKAVAGALVFVLFSAIVWVLTILDATSGSSQGEKNVISCMNSLFDYSGGVTNSSSTIDYVVQPGETLESIASRYNVSVTSIRNANAGSFTGNEDVVEGQTIKIPVSNNGTTNGYTDPDPICKSYGYHGALKLTSTGGGYIYHCYKYDRSKSNCADGYPANGKLYELEDGKEYCLVTNDNNVNYAYNESSNIIDLYIGSYYETKDENETIEHCRTYCSKLKYLNAFLATSYYGGTDGVHCICVNKQQ